MRILQLLDQPTIKVLGIALALLLCWRLWRFTIRPALYPHEPKELPYWIPVVGHAVGFLMDFNAAIEKGRRHFLPACEPFAMTVGGETLYVATAPEHINAVWRNTKQLSRDPPVMDMFIVGGLDKRGQDLMSSTHPAAAYNAANQPPLPPFQAALKLHQQQLHKGPRLDVLIQDRILPGISQQLNFSRPNHPAVLSRSEKATTVSLYQLAIHTFIAGGSNAYFGPALLRVSPNHITAMAEWEYVSWKFIFQLPCLLARDMHRVKSTLINGFAAYHSLRNSEKPGALWWTTETEKLLLEVGFTAHEMGLFTLLHYWAIVGNTYKFGFWLLAHLVHDPALLAAIRTEVLPAVRPDDSIDEEHLSTQCPRLDALSNEVLRLKIASSVARAATQTCIIGGKTIPEGTKIMLPISSLHAAPAVFPDPSTLDPGRFADNPKLAKSPSFRPWGGGHGLCPGRFFARRSVNAFVAMLLARYDVAVEDGGQMPELDRKRPSPGMGMVVKGGDVRIRCVRRV